MSRFTLYAGLTMEERGALAILCDLAEERGGETVPDDALFLGGWLGCTARKWRLIRASLIVKDRLAEDGGNLRIISEKSPQNLGKISEKSPENVAEISAFCETKVNEISESPRVREAGARAEVVIPSEPKGSSGVFVCNADASFADWWAEYPRKKARAAALKAYRSALRKPGVTPEALLAGIRRDGDDWRDRATPPDKIPHAATWLNGERWADEPDPQATNIHPLRPHDRTDHHQRPSPRDDRLRRMLAGAMAAVDGAG